MNEFRGLTGYNCYFWRKYCSDCDKDNEDADPTCEYLKAMMEGGKPPSECEGREGK